MARMELCQVSWQDCGGKKLGAAKEWLSTIKRRAVSIGSAFIGGVVITAALLAASSSGSGKAHASEVVTHCYDALGRLTQTGRVGGPSAGKTTDTSYDPAGNRSNQTTASGTVDCNDPTGAGGTGGSGGGGDPQPTGPSFTVNDVVGTEGDVFVFTITKVGAATGSHSVSYATANGTTGAQDYTAVSGTLTFTSTQTTKTVSVTTTHDIKMETTEIFYLNLSGATGGATISDAQGKGTLFNDDGACATCFGAADE